MPFFFCDYCHKDTQFLTIQKTIRLATVSRSTVYYWMEHEWIHWRELPSGRRVICQESLSHNNSTQAQQSSTERIVPKPFETVRNRMIS
jgi:hypothetical protein